MLARSHENISSGKRQCVDLNHVVSSLEKTNSSAFSASKAETKLAEITAGRRQCIPIDNNSKAPDIAIADFLQSFRDRIDQQSFDTEIEIELRFGKITSYLTELRCLPSQENVGASIVLTEEQMRKYGAKFVSGVHAQEFPVFLKGLSHLCKSGEFLERTEKSTVYEISDGKRLISYDHKDGPKPSHLQEKKRLGSLNIFLPHCSYDCRISVACEGALKTVENEEALKQDAENLRLRDRTSAIGKDIHMDMTEVSVEFGQKKKIHEVELELTNALTQEWLQQSDDGDRSLNKAINHASILWKWVRFFMPHVGQAYKTSWDSLAASELQNAYSKRLGGNRNRFNGTMPVGFARWHIPFVKKGEYHVSEKTDGVRYFLVVAGGSTVLVDRSNAAYTTCGIDQLKLVLPEGTVLDGEFVFHQKEKRYVFMAFDIIATGPTENDSHVSKTFTERLQILNDFLSENGPYAAGMREHGISRHAILTILKKRWVPLRHLADVLRQIQRVQKRDHSVARIYDDEKRVHFTDGIIFCPNTPYVSNTHKEYLKWKWADLITIDVAVSVHTETNRVSLSCGGPDNTRIDLDAVIILDPKDVPAVQKVIQNAQRRICIVEIGFNPEKGLWNYKCPRPDKNCANYIQTVLGTLVNLAEAITEEELVYRLTSAQGGQWGDHMKRARRNLLQ
ncbi:hypothetical protein ABG067_005446 [Albugo candida]